jgi:hypothetical protein
VQPDKRNTIIHDVLLNNKIGYNAVSHSYRPKQDQKKSSKRTSKIQNQRRMLAIKPAKNNKTSKGYYSLKPAKNIKTSKLIQHLQTAAGST